MRAKVKRSRGWVRFQDNIAVDESAFASGEDVLVSPEMRKAERELAAKQVNIADLLRNAIARDERKTRAELRKQLWPR